MAFSPFVNEGFIMIIKARIMSKVRVILPALLTLFSVVLAQFVSANETDSQLDLEPLKGKVVYVDFWASWCAPCKASFAYMNDIKAQYSPEDFEIILINLDHDPHKAERFLARVKAPSRSLFDPKGKLARRFNVSAMPTSILIGRDGKIRYTHDGFFPAKIQEYTSQLEELIDEK